MDEPNTDPIEIDSRIEAILRRYPDRFGDGQIVEIRKRIERSIVLADALRGYSLENSVGPEFHPRTMNAANPVE